MKFELEPDNQGRPDNELLDDLRAVAKMLATGSVTAPVYNEHGRFSAATLARRFGSWNMALRTEGLEPALEHRVTREVLLNDLRAVATKLGASSITQSVYNEHGRFSAATLGRRYGTWNEAIKAAGLEPAIEQRITQEDLFDDLERAWRQLGRQPRRDEVNPPLSTFSSATYVRRFGSWRKALEAFVAAIEESSEEDLKAEPRASVPASTASVSRQPRRTPRTVNWRLRFLTLRRDGFRCKACGRSPANEPGVKLEVDHVVPWSDDGETVLENLQSLCEKCNGGKSNLPFTAG